MIGMCFFYIVVKVDVGNLELFEHVVIFVTIASSLLRLGTARA